ncbi:zinc-dependent peptidase [Aquisalimonas lutea]|uniref:M90 family metallopeptidase n=1 Tax=Aquisalimonas lutea TaxID=1327750 RepID=UPI0025B56335|nr:M90 family metallopeptidase [Aquisalimonas lutea]MDN3516180.1 zinc-dependent peptidase [Aquisalimonas lutea]
MLDRIRRWRSRRVLRRAAINTAVWDELMTGLPVCAGLDADERARLHRTASLFLHDKRLEPLAGVVLDESRRAALAALACLPVLNLGLAAYRGWRTVLIYPEEFLARHAYTDDAGLAHEEVAPLAGEAWDGGPVVLSWEDVERSLELDGYNVVIHEFCHKLDMSNGEANGLPPLPAEMPLAAWTQAFTEAYDRMCADVEAGRETLLDPYAAEAPGEFFAVACESFFERPRALRAAMPAVYDQLRQYFRQDPGRRLA